LAPRNPEPSILGLRAADSLLVETFVAESLEDAMHQRDVFLGWAKKEE
jgi:hypothetical protein